MGSDIDVQTTVVCDCGWVLLDDLGPVDVHVSGRTFPLRRSTDHILCPGCDEAHRVIDLRAEAASSST